MRALDDLRRTFGSEAEALEGPETILRLQLEALDREPPQALPESVAEAASTRLLEGSLIIPRLRLPSETGRVADLMARLAQALLGDASGLLHGHLASLIGDAVLAALVDDGGGVRRALSGLAVPTETAESLFREALKPEMLRTSLAFGELVRVRARGRTCPLCGSGAAALTPLDDVLCSCCGTVWRRERVACASCGSPKVRRVELQGLQGAALEQCSACGEALGVFDTVADPLVLSLFAVLSAPLRTVARVNAGAEPERGYRLF